MREHVPPNAGGWGEGEPVLTEPPISLQKPPEFYDPGVKFEASKKS